MGPYFEREREHGGSLLPLTVVRGVGCNFYTNYEPYLNFVPKINFPKYPEKRYNMATPYHFMLCKFTFPKSMIIPNTDPDASIYHRHTHPRHTFFIF